MQPQVTGHMVTGVAYTAFWFAKNNIGKRNELIKMN